MKTLCILSYQRTGSSWLCDILGGENTISLQEIFSRDPLLFNYTLSILLSRIYNVESSIIDTFNKIYNLSNFFVDNKSYIQIKKNILEKKPYSIELLKTIQKKVYDKKFNLIFKIFPEHIEELSLKEIINISDYIIINYRNNLLESFISEQKSVLSQRWTSLQTERPYLEKIEWNEKKYLSYVNKTIDTLNLFLNTIEDKKYVLISYEDIHFNNVNKNKIIVDKVKLVYNDFDFKLKNSSLLKKENYIKNIKENFINEKDFIKSLNSGIKVHIYE